MSKLFSSIKHPFEGQAKLMLAANRILLHAIIAGTVCTVIVILL